MYKKKKLLNTRAPNKVDDEHMMNLLSSSLQTCPINGDQAGSISEGKKWNGIMDDHKSKTFLSFKEVVD